MSIANDIHDFSFIIPLLSYYFFPFIFTRRLTSWTRTAGKGVAHPVSGTPVKHQAAMLVNFIIRPDRFFSKGNVLKI
jgi:hypothetical protein